MKHLQAVLSFLRSKTLTVWLLGLFILYYLIVAVWFKEAFAHLVQHLSDHMLFQAAYVLLFLNVTFRIAGAVRSLRRDRSRLFLRVPLYAGMVLFLFSFFLSLNVREDRKMLVGEGDVLEIPWENTLFRVVSVEPALKKNLLRTNDAVIFDYEPGVSLVDGAGVRFPIGAFPPKKVHATYMHVLNFGIGPGVELRRNNQVVSQGYVALRLTPFGQVDSFEMAGLPYKFYVSIVPNRIMKKGKETARDYDLTRPRYHVEVAKGDRVIARATTDSGITFDGPMRLSFSTPYDWVLLETAHDPFLPWFAAGLALLAAGLVLYPFSFLGRPADAS